MTSTPGDEPLRIELDVDPDDAGEPGDPGDAVHPGAPPASGTGDGPGPWRARLSRRRVAMAGGGLVLAAAAALGSEALRDQAQEAQLRTAPGGVLSLAEPLAETWSRGLAFGEAVRLPEALAVVDDGDLLALDPVTGEPVWSVPVGDGSWCGPSGYQQGAVVEVLVCLTPEPGAEDGWYDGSAGSGVLSAVTSGGELLGTSAVAAGERVAVGPEGTVVRLARVGPSPEGPGCAEDGCVEGGLVVRGRDLQIRVEDVGTGEPRWTEVVPFDPGETEVSSCLELTETGMVPDPGAVTAWAEGPALTVVGCGVRVGFTAAGERLDTDQWRGVEPLGDGYLVRGVLRDVVVGRDGSRRELPGRLMVPLATDGTVPDVLFVDLGSEVRAEDDAGRELWTAQMISDRVLVLAGGVALMDDGAGNVTALDVGTGEDLWASTRLEAVAGLDLTAWAPTIEQAFTDGRRALVTMRGVPSESGVLVFSVVVDLRTGEVVWKDSRVGWETLVAVDGHLVVMSEGGIAGLG
ncbi:PQQ-binding-like beta-propeller repeat protein [Antribacter gilvus]|uniref:outer membrane protein assembly factor BamB family protein n=1 Tax=Antribacter gilvus TaxID=2304675 RepID=UPI000F7AD544|nr:PQQ-binding-like beta-propeller repeat protein [Antribacter gilvus]